MRKSKRLSWLLTMVFLFTILLGAVPSQAVAAELSDIGNHWAQGQIQALVDRGVVTGYPDNTFKPDNTITRAEFITMTNKAYSFTATAEINYTDVSASDWYAPEIAKAKAAGYIDGYEDGTMRPEALISRQEAAKIISSILGLDSSSDSALSDFTDAASIPDWSRGYVAAMVKAGFISGYPDGTFKAEKALTRAEAAVILGRVIGVTPVIQTVFSEAGTYGPATGTQTIDGDVIISADGVNLQNTIIKGNLIIDEAVAEGSVNLKNVTVTGTSTIKGGGTDPNGVTFENSTLKEVIVNKTSGPVTVSFLDGSNVSKLTLNSPATVAGSGVSQAIINADSVFESTPTSYTVANGVTAKFGDKVVVGPASYPVSSGGSSGGGSSTSLVAPVTITTDGTIDVVTLAELTTLSTTTTGADIYYTIDGSTPTSASNLYIAPIYVNVGTTLKAIAIKSGVSSSVTSWTYSTANITADKTYGPALGSGIGTVTVLGNVSLTGSGATTTLLQNMIINGDLIIDVGSSGNVELNNVTVNGTTNIKSAASSSVRATGTSYLVNVSVTSTTAVSVVAADNSVIGNLTVSSTQNVTLVASENGEFTNTSITSSNNVTLNTDATGIFSNVNVQSAAAQTVNVSGNVSNITLTGTVATNLNIAAGSTVTNISSATAAASTIDLNGVTITTVQLQTTASITGTGTIGSLIATPTVQTTTTVATTITVTRIEVSAPADVADITVNNLVGANDTVTVTGLNEDEVVTVYLSATGSAVGNAIATGADGQATATVSGLNLGLEKGNVWVSVITPGAIESVKVQKPFDAEPIAERPTANPGAGWIASGQEIILTAEAGASIYYTDDGTTPTTASTLYSAPIPITSQTDLKAIAVVAGKNNSPVLNANYKIMGTVVTPMANLASGAVKPGTLVSLVCATAGATIYYTTDGSVPTDRSILYSDPIAVNAAMTIKARAIKSDLLPSSILSVSYTLMQTCATPVASPVAGTVDSGTEVTLTTATEGADIYYTIDGSIPTKSSSKYTAAITIAGTTTIKAIAVKDGNIDSDVLTAIYTKTGEVAQPTANPAAGYVAAGTAVALTTTTEGATIYYTIDGSVPSSASTLYENEIVINATQTIQAIAIKEDMTNSAVFSATYTVTADQVAPTETLTGVAPTSATTNDGKITGTTDAMEYKLSTADTYVPVTTTEITDLAAGTYNVRYAAKDGFNAGESVNVIVPEYEALASQAKPTGLAGIAPSSATSTDGKITGTTTDMEYKLSTAASYSDASATETTGLAAGTYYVRLKAKSGYDAGAIAEIVVPAVKNKDQAAPTGLLGVKPATETEDDGKITGTTIDMEYKLSTADSYTAASAGETIVPEPGIYYVRYAAKPGLNAGGTATVVVPPFEKIVASVSSVAATNGTITITLDKIPTVDPVAADFIATTAINGGVAQSLAISGFAYNKAAKTVSYSFTPIAQTATAQSVVIAVTYKTIKTSAPAFNISALGSIIIVGGDISVDAGIGTVSGTFPNVTITGSDCPFAEVSIKVLRPDNTILYVDVASCSEGTFSQSFSLPDETTGIFTVVYGQGSVVSTGTFEVQ